MKTLRLALLMVVLAPAAGANGPTNAKPPVVAARATSAIDVDGVLSEQVWQAAAACTDFTQRDPVEGARPSQKSEVRIAYDDDALYVGARLYDTAPDSIIARLTRRDVSIPADRFAIYLDPYHDKRSGYYFLVNAAGTLFDGTLSNDGWEDNSWDGVWEGKARVDQNGWTVEMRIPYSQLRFQQAERYVWGVNFRRVVARHSEEDFLVYQPKKESGFVSRFPDLVGIENVRPGRAIEILPYGTTQAAYLPHAAADPFNDGSLHEVDGGLDLRMGLGSKLTLNGTVNPDFGQVEVDPAVVNLSDVETFYPEKRPFFVEGSSIFNFGNQGANDYWGFNWPDPKFFYSRRIGRAPQGEVPDADFQDVPSGTTILGAGKVTGKLASTWNFGTLHALTAKETAELQTGGTPFAAEVEPLTYYGVIRGQKEFKDRQQGLGLMTTYAQRSFEDPSLRDQLNGSSLMTGMDGWVFLDSRQTWVISGWSALSYVQGSETRMTTLQQDPRHRFQRPDAGHVSVDPSATSLAGWGSRYWLNKQNGNVLLNAALGAMSPGFEVNDLGFQVRSDLINGHFGTGYKWTEPTKLRKFQDVIGAVFGSWNMDGDAIWGGGFLTGSTEFINDWSWSYRAAYNPQLLNDRRTRGGPLMINKPGFELGTYFDTDAKAKLFYYIDTGSYTQPDVGSWSWYFYPGLEWKPVSNLSLSLGPGYERNVDDAQYVDQIPDAAAIETYGARYVFARLDQTTVSATIRLNWSFTPTLSLQTYLQPLVSAGDYTDFKALARPASYDFTPYAYSDNPDFNFRSLRGNSVFRWEYLPGSTLFLVWTQERTESEATGEFNFGHDFHSLTEADPQNRFMAKVTYYFSL